MLKRVKKPDNFHFICDIDICDVESMISRFSEKVWQTENSAKENNFDCFHHTQHIIFRFIEGMRDPEVFYSNPIWEICQSTLLPIFDQISSHYGFTNPVYPKAMLARLNPGYRIDPHTDGAGANLYTHKIHIPLQTNADAIMHIADASMHLEKAKAYEVNNLKPHSVSNMGTDDRIHLIFEVFDKGN